MSMEEQVQEEYSKLGNRVSALESDMSNLIRSVERLGDSVDRMNQRVVAGNSTNWGVLGTWSGILVSVIGGLGFLAIMPLRSGLELHQSQLVAAHSMFREHEQMEGHPTAIAKFTALEKSYDEVRKDITEQIRALDTALQREMRDLDSGQKQEVDQRLDALDKLLQMEIKGVQDQLNIFAEEMIANRDKREKAIEIRSSMMERINNIDQMVKWGAGNASRSQ